MDGGHPQAPRRSGSGPPPAARTRRPLAVTGSPVGELSSAVVREAPSARFVDQSEPIRDLKAKIPRVAGPPFPVDINGRSSAPPATSSPDARALRRCSIAACVQTTPCGIDGILHEAAGIRRVRRNSVTVTRQEFAARVDSHLEVCRRDFPGPSLVRGRLGVHPKKKHRVEKALGGAEKIDHGGLTALP